jgi:hypothetical protein
MGYLIDTDVLIRAKNLHYGFDFCPAFWTWLTQENAAGKVFSVEKVGDEVLAGEDALAEWAAQRGTGFFLPPDEKVAPAFAAVTEWARSGKYEPPAITTFLQLGDYYLVAQALAGGHAVVTHEAPSDSTRKIKIPDACLGLKIKCVSPYEMLRRERARFVLGSKT